MLIAVSCEHALRCLCGCCVSLCPNRNSAVQGWNKAVTIRHWPSCTRAVNVTCAKICAFELKLADQVVVYIRIFESGGNKTVAMMWLCCLQVVFNREVWEVAFF